MKNITEQFLLFVVAQRQGNKGEVINRKIQLPKLQDTRSDSTHLLMFSTDQGK